MLFFLPFGVAIPLVLIPGLLLTTRMWALYNRSKIVAIPLLFLLIAQIALCLWIYITPGVGALTLPNINVEAFHFCILLGPPKLGLLTSLYQWTETIFDVSVFGLTVWKTLNRGKIKSDQSKVAGEGLMTRIIRDAQHQYVH